MYTRRLLIVKEKKADSNSNSVWWPNFRNGHILEDFSLNNNNFVLLFWTIQSPHFYRDVYDHNSVDLFLTNFNLNYHWKILESTFDSDIFPWTISFSSRSFLRCSPKWSVFKINKDKFRSIVDSSLSNIHSLLNPMYRYDDFFYDSISSALIASSTPVHRSKKKRNVHLLTSSLWCRKITVQSLLFTRFGEWLKHCERPSYYSLP